MANKVETYASENNVIIAGMRQSKVESLRNYWELEAMRERIEKELAPMRKARAIAQGEEIEADGFDTSDFYSTAHASRRGKGFFSREEADAALVLQGYTPENWATWK